jgi:hypothetical protein
MGLLHRHFDMTADEVLVEHGPTSAPWTLPPDPLNFMGGRIAPRSWCFADDSGDLRPYEFGFEPHDELKRSEVIDLECHGDFIAELRTVLEKHQLTPILGLVALPPEYLPTSVEQKKVMCEKTFGRANVVFEVGAEAMYEKDKRTSIWTFGKFANGGRESMLCFSGCICSGDLDD